MTTNFVQFRTIKGYNDFGTPFCDSVFTATLGAAVDTALLVPVTAAMGAPTATTFNKFLAVFHYQPNSFFWVALNAAAAAPGGAAFALSSSELNPPAKMVKAGDTIHALCTAGGSLSVAFYAIQE